MPGSLRGAVAVATLPSSLSAKFTKAHGAVARANEYHDGSTQRASMVAGARRSWKLAKRLTLSDILTLRAFWEANHATAFYFYDPFETTPPFTKTPTGTDGRYVVRFASDWNENINIVRHDAQVDLIELADDAAIAAAASDPTSPTSAISIQSAIAYLVSAHHPNGSSSQWGGGAGFNDVLSLLSPYPSWFRDISTWSKRTDSHVLSTAELATLQNRTAYLLIDQYHEGSGAGPYSPPDEFWIYDCYISIVMMDGSTQTWRPTKYATSGTVINPANAIDGDNTSYAIIRAAGYSIALDGSFLNLNTFLPA